MTSTRQKMILFSILAVLASSVTAFAELCEDGQSMAESAGLSAEQKLSTGCKVNLNATIFGMIFRLRADPGRQSPLGTAVAWQYFG